MRLRCSTRHFSERSPENAAYSLPPPRALPVNPPTSTRHRSPDKFLQWCSLRMVVEHGGALIEPSGVPRVRKPNSTHRGMLVASS